MARSCKICDIVAAEFDSGLILGKYSVRYFRCPKCGFIQTEQPYWLNEAYSAAIAKQDVGVMQRNLLNTELTAAILKLIFPNMSKALDFGGGHGMFVRLMRDQGFDFRWYDSYASNDYSRGFEHADGAIYDFLTAFEVMEHLTQPIDEISRLMNMSHNVLLSTLLVPEPAPKLSSWWYYAPVTGQHIAFYTPASLKHLANRFGRHVLSNGQYHLFTKDPKSASLFRLATSHKAAWLINRFIRRPSLTERDFQQAFPQA